MPSGSDLSFRHSEAQRGLFQKQAFRNQKVISEQWGNSHGPCGPIKLQSHWANSFGDDPRSLPSLAPNGGPGAGEAGLPTPRDIRGAPGVAGGTDFGMTPPASPRTRPVGAPRFRTSDIAAATQASRRSSSAAARDDKLAVRSSRLRPLRPEGPRDAKGREMRSARTAFGFVYPDSRFGLTTKMRDDRLGDGNKLPPNGENYALDYHVHRAQCRPEGIYHVVTGAF